MRVSRLTIENFRGIKKAQLHFTGHTLLIGGNNLGKSTMCEALDLVLGPDRLNRLPPVEEFDFHNARYLSDDGAPIPIRIEVVLTDLSPEALSHFRCWITWKERAHVSKCCRTWFLTHHSNQDEHGDLIKLKQFLGIFKRTLILPCA